MNLYTGYTRESDRVPKQCPAEKCYDASCDESCPLFPDRICEGLLSRGAGGAAVRVACEAVVAAPFTVEAWMRFGRVNERLGRMGEAHNAYLCAFALTREPDTELNHALCRTLIGLHLWDRAEACEEKTDEMVAAIAAGRQSGAERGWAAQLLLSGLIDMATNDGLVEAGRFSLYAPIMAQAHDVCSRLRRELTDYDARTGGTISTGVMFAWAAYAGMGARWHHWHDELALREKGIADTLLEPRGVFAMDEEVLDLVGLPFRTPQSRVFERGLRYELCDAVGDWFDEQGLTASEEALMEYMKAFYFLGVGLETARLPQPGGDKEKE